MSEQISSILIRKLGGWKLVSVDQWVNFKSGWRNELIAAHNVQFFSGDLAVDATEAQVELGLAEPPVGESGLGGAQPQIYHWERREHGVQELPMRATINAMYSRSLNNGVRWVIDRDTWVSGTRELSEVRNRAAPEIYDLQSWHGATVLSADLMADALEIVDDGLEAINGTAVEHFRSKFLEPILGTAEWKVSALRIRESLSFNPYVKLLNG